MAALLYAAALLAAGFALGRARLGTRLTAWAQAATQPGSRAWKILLAAPILLAALAWIWIVHPRRTLTNILSWQAGQRLAPVPEYNPLWPSGRIECGLSGGRDWWCQLSPGHSGGCIPRRDGTPS